MSSDLTYGQTSSNFTQKPRSSILLTGPGQYDIPNLTNASKIGTSFGAKLDNIKKPYELNPGPGSQTLKTSFGDGPRFSIQGKTADNFNRKLGRQDGKSKSTNCLTNTYTNIRNTQQYSIQSPGPGDQNIKYTQDFESSPSTIFGSQKRFNGAKDFKTISPGPSAQNIKSTLKRTNSGIFNKQERWSPKNYASITPGPGNYDYNPTKQLADFINSPKCIFPRSSREYSIKKDCDKSGRSLSPGPCDYSPHEPLVKSYVATMGKKKRGSVLKYRTPGPGSQNNLKLPSGTGLKFRTSIINNNKNLTPGPSDYESDVQKPKTYGGTIGNSTRDFGIQPTVKKPYKDPVDNKLFNNIFTKYTKNLKKDNMDNSNSLPSIKIIK